MEKIEYTSKNADKKRGISRRHKQLLFSAVILALPILQFCIFWIYVNINSILMAFKTYTANTDGLGYTVTFAGFENFSLAWATFTENLYMVKNSLILYVCQLVIGMALELFFAYYIYKKKFCSGFFKVILFLPQIISSVVFCILFKFLVGQVYTTVTGEVGLLSDPSTRFGTLLFYNIWIAFGVNVLMFTSAMNEIDPSIVESAHLEGVTAFQEFIYISFPMIFPTFTTFVIIGLSGLFTNQMNLFTFFGLANDADSRPVSTFGFYLYMQSSRATLTTIPGGRILSYSILSALGLILTMIIFPITLLVRHLLNKLDPNAE